MRRFPFTVLLAAAALTGCGGGGGGGSGGASLLPSTPSPGGGDSGFENSQVNESTLAASSLLGYSRQLSGSSAQSEGGAGEVYDPQTQSSVARSFVQATLSAAAVSRSKGAYLIASSTYGIATAARDLLAGIGAGSGSYTFLDTGDSSTSNRSAYLGTPENSLVNILSNPLYTRRGSELVGGLIISPDDIGRHGWIVSDTGFDGDVDPVAGITGRKWLGAHSSEIASGYRQAASTGKVRLFYGLSGDGKGRHAASNGCKGFEQYCLGTPYFVRIRNGQGRYIDVEGAFVSTYGFAAYLMSWERMPEDTHISEVFELGDECAHDLGVAGADADTGLGRLDMGCMAERIYLASVVPEPESNPPPPVTVAVSEPESKEPPPVTVTVAEPESKVPPPVTATVAEPESEESPPVTATVAEPESEEPLKVVARQKEELDALSSKLAGMGVTVATSRKENAYVVGYATRFMTIALLVGNEDFRNYYVDLYGRQIGVNIHEAEELLSEIGVARGDSYTFLDASKGSASNYEKMYVATPENSIVYFAVNPFYVDGAQAKDAFVASKDGNSDATITPTEILMDSEYVMDHGWIVSGVGYDIKDTYDPDWDKRDIPAWYMDYDNIWINNGELIRGYRKALATGKVRLFYPLTDDQTKRASRYANSWGWDGCRFFERYCIGVPHGAHVLEASWPGYVKATVKHSHLSAAYGYGVYLLAWERMPENTHVSAVFAMGDRCTEDMGERGADPETGLGRLDIGCMANEVYKVSLDPVAATLSVAAKVMEPQATVALVAGRKAEDHYVLDDPASIQGAFSDLGVTVAVGRKEKAYSMAQCNHCPSTRLLGSMGLLGYTVLDTQGGYYGAYYGASDHDESTQAVQEAYKTTPENSIVYFQLQELIEPKLVSKHGWIVSGVAYAGSPWSWGTRLIDYNLWLQDDDYKEQLERRYREALATGKVRLFYALSVDQGGHVRKFMNNWGTAGCEGVEAYCIGVPHRIIGYNIDKSSVGRHEPYHGHGFYRFGHESGFDLEAAYAFGVYLTAWERMPEDTHISEVFAMGDRCAQDIGEKGPDADTGLGYLDVGCMASEVYKANQGSLSATLSVAANPVQSLMTGDVSLEGASEQSQSQSDDDGQRQRFLDGFAQDLFSDLGVLSLPGATDAGLMMGFPGDSFQGRYRPAQGVQPHYHVSMPQPRYALAGDGIGVMGIGDGEVGIFARMDGLDLSFSYSRSEDFFGGRGSGQFGFDGVGNVRLLLQSQALPGSDEHSLLLGGWLRRAQVSGGRGALLGGLRGDEYGFSMRYDWQRGDGLSVSATAFAARFAGGEVELAGSSFGIGSSDWKWSVGVSGTYEF